MSLSREHNGVFLALKCSVCKWTGTRKVADQGYGSCPRCQAPAVRRPAAFADVRAARAKADLERMGR